METLPYNPENLIIANVEVDDTEPTLKTKAANGKWTVISRNYQYFSVTFTYKALTTDAVKKASAFLSRNSTKPFRMSVPGWNAPAAPLAGTPTISGNYVAGSSTVRVEGFTGKITEGDCFTLANDNKVYMALNDLTAAGDLLIKPTLRQPVTTSTPMNFNPLMTVRLVDDQISYKTEGVKNIRTYEIEVREDL